MRETLINNFLRIAKVPRMSGNEKKISDFFVEVAKNNNLEYYQDENYNVLIKKKGNTEGDTIAFQAHLDMVCKKREGSNHDFNTDGIDVVINGDEVTARDTTLGADQGVGLSLMLALIEDKSITHPDLEFLFTVEEETDEPSKEESETSEEDQSVVDQMIEEGLPSDNVPATAEDGETVYIRTEGEAAEDGRNCDIVFTVVDENDNPVSGYDSGTYTITVISNSTML